MSLIERLEREKSVKDKTKKEKKGVGETKEAGGDPYSDLKARIQKRLIEETDELDTELLKDKSRADELRNKTEEAISTMLVEEGLPLGRAERIKIVQEILDEVLSFGPLQPLLDDPTISEIMVINAQQIYVERRGKLELTNKVFRDNEHVMRIIDKVVTAIGRRCDESTPLVDARLPDGSRFNAIIPPLALKGPCVTIRKFSKDPFTIEDLIGFGSLTREMAEFLEACVKARLNTIISGGTGSGKTTTLNVLSSFIPHDERIVTIEDAAELQLRQEHVVTLEARPANIEGKGEIPIRRLVINALRMRPDRIVVGECRGAEALDMLQAMNTGHDGSLTTGHANSPRDILSRLETMVMMAGMELPAKSIREQIASAIHLIVQQSRLQDGTRRITHITEVQGMEGDTITLQDIFIFTQEGVDEKGKIKGKLKATGIRPKFAEKFEPAGIHLPPSIFTPKP